VVTDFPSVAGNDITSCLISNLETKKNYDLQYSFDGGVSYSTLQSGTMVGWSPKGDLKQIKIKRAGSVDIDFDIIINRKA